MAKGADTKKRSSAGMLRIIICALLAICIGFALWVEVPVLREAKRNDQSPVLTALAEVKEKKRYDSEISYTYYVTFKTESGEPMEFMVGRDVYRRLNEGDRGELAYQGTRLLRFAFVAAQSDPENDSKGIRYFTYIALICSILAAGRAVKNKMEGDS